MLTGSRYLPLHRAECLSTLARSGIVESIQNLEALQPRRLRTVTGEFTGSQSTYVGHKKDHRRREEV